MNEEFDLSGLKPLTTDQYDLARNRAFTRTRARIGDKPKRSDFERELGRLWTVLDVIALVVFMAALAVSSVHIIAHMGVLASQSYPEVQSGTIFSKDFYTAVHQWMVVPLAEGSMILFLVMFGMTRNNWRKWVYFTLALVAVVFIMVANWQSGIGLLESLLPPVFTVGIGLKLEHLIVQSLKRRESVTTRYLDALHIWENASADTTKHPDYLPILRQEIWQKLMTLASNRDYKDAPPAFKAAAVAREMERDTWAYDLPGVTLPPATMNGNHREVEPVDFLSLPVMNGHSITASNPGN